jgi:hypothetical protein
MENKTCRFCGIDRTVSHTDVCPNRFYDTIHEWVDEAGNPPLAAADIEIEIEGEDIGIVESPMEHGAVRGLVCLGTAVSRIIIKRVAKDHPQTVAVGDAQVTIPAAQEDDFTETITVVETNMPKLEHVPIRRFRYAPDLRRGDPRCAEWCGRIIYVTMYDLDALRDTAGWDIPTRAELVKLTTPQMQNPSSTNPLETQSSSPGNTSFQQTTTPQRALPETQSDQVTHDPLMRKFELFDYWTGSRHAIILQNEKCILNETHKFGKPPFLGFCFRNAPDSAHGYGIAFWLTDFQRICQGVVNAFLDDLNLNLMGTYTAPAGTANSAQSQWIFPGKIFKADANGKVEAIQRNSIGAKEPMDVIAQMKSWAASITGAGPGTLGSNPGAAGEMRTPAGVAAISGGESVKLQDLVDVVSEQVLVPFLEFCMEQNQKLKPSQIRQMLSLAMGEAFKATPLDILNGTYRVDISAGTKLAAREALNKYIGVLQTFLSSPGTVENLATQAMKIDYNAMFEALYDSFGVPYKEKIIVPMDDDDKARMQAESQQAAAQNKLGQISAQGEVKKDVDNNAAENRMLVETGKSTLKHQATDHDASVASDAAKAERATPEAEGLNRAARGAFATMDKSAFLT